LWTHSVCKGISSSVVGCQRNGDRQPFGLLQPHTLDIEDIDADIGNESVPVLRKYYDERKPANGERITVSHLYLSSTVTGTPR
jgi:hypothetical protein